MVALAPLRDVALERVAEVHPGPPGPPLEEAVVHGVEPPEHVGHAAARPQHVSPGVVVDHYSGYVEVVNVKCSIVVSEGKMAMTSN